MADGQQKDPPAARLLLLKKEVQERPQTFLNLKKYSFC